MEERITVRQWRENYINGMYDEKDIATMCDAGWYDWFCSNKALCNRLKKFGSIIKKINNDFILDNYYVWFKNNCPCTGPLYDDMRFEPIDENLRDELYFLVCVDCPWDNKKFGIATARNNYEKEYEFDTQKEVVEWINNFNLKKGID